METVVHLALASDPDARVTPLELLEDFADASPAWHYLEAESQHYAAEKGAPACVLRYRHDGDAFYLDFAFAATPDAPDAIELVLIDPPHGVGAPHGIGALDLGLRHRVMDRFLDALRAYLAGRPGHATLHVARDAIDPEALGAA
jgi:hypothetical protein